MPQYIGIGGIARKVTKSYIGVGGVGRNIKTKYTGISGVARKYFGSIDVSKLSITYTGTMTDQIVEMSGTQYRLLTLTSSGTLTVDQEVNAEVWMCSGGSSGKWASSGLTGGGGAGGFVASGNAVLFGNMAAIVGAGGKPINSKPYYSPGEASSFGGIVTSVNFTGGADEGYFGYGVSGGSGGGSGGTGYSAGSGDGISKYPFNDSAYFPDPHCAGGGGAGYLLSAAPDLLFVIGGGGGSNGGNGESTIGISEGRFLGGAGGNKGGGEGGSGSSSKGSDATYYGSGGGGGNENYGGNGYQGVIYVRIPIEQ